MLDDLVERYIQLRDRKAALEKDCKEKTAVLSEAMERCEKIFLAAMNEQGLESLPTKAGVPYKTTKTSATVADPAAYRQWVIDNNAWAALDVKANKTFVKEYKEEHQDLPPGINWFEQIAVNVRRS